jgi:hypothetical protein
MARILFAALKRELKALLVAGRKVADVVAEIAGSADVGRSGRGLTSLEVEY